MAVACASGKRRRCCDIFSAEDVHYVSGPWRCEANAPGALCRFLGAEGVGMSFVPRTYGLDEAKKHPKSTSSPERVRSLVRGTRNWKQGHVDEHGRSERTPNGVVNVRIGHALGRLVLTLRTDCASDRPAMDEPAKPNGEGIEAPKAVLHRHLQGGLGTGVRDSKLDPDNGRHHGSYPVGKHDVGEAEG